MAVAIRRKLGTRHGAVPLLQTLAFLAAAFVACSAAIANPPVPAPRPALTSVVEPRERIGVMSSPIVRLVRPSSEFPAVMASAATIAPFVSSAPSDPVLVGAGDIANCRLSADSATARVVASIPGVAFTAGDNAYPDGTAADFRNCYAPTWGVFRDRTMPAIGNHEYHTGAASGYFDYFGARAGTRGRGWYSKDVGTWHVVVLNSNCGVVGCGSGSRQLAWLKADLAAHPSRCTLAIWHHPLFSSGSHGNEPSVRPFWRVLAAAGAEVIVNGHDHDYERFAPQTPSGGLDTRRGIREFVVGTGGAPLRRFATVRANSRARASRTHGVLLLTLHSNSYDWRFARADGVAFSDRGSTYCH